MRKLKSPALSFIALAMLAAGCASIPEKPVLPFLDQGSNWNSSTRETYYTQDQGSQLIPLNWFMALRQPNGELFARDSLTRYGYLPNPKSPVPGLAVGFTTNTDSSGSHVGMTCSACHTRQIYVAGQAYRIDGGPAISDFQTFMADLDQAVGHVLNDQPAFDQFSQAVLGANATQADKTKLRTDLSAWYTPYHAIVKGSLPVNSPWGPARLDAISMIFNRLTGLDIGPPPTYIIEENIKLADAPARYPFLWNAAIQDYTQWPGFSPNGNLLLGLSRNAGEVIGVFGKFHPVKDSNSLLGIDYVKNNSMNFPGLNEQEITIGKLGPPKWPWALDKNLVAQGEKVFNQKDHTNQSCADCHGIKKGEFRSLFSETWATPILDVGTDSREVNLLGSQVKTGVLAGAKIIGQPLKPVDSAFSVLALAVEGSILQHYFPPDPPSASKPSESEAQKMRALLQGKFAAEIKGKADTRDVGQI
jgi:cytochrome c553